MHALGEFLCHLVRVHQFRQRMESFTTGIGGFGHGSLHQIRLVGRQRLAVRKRVNCTIRWKYYGCNVWLSVWFEFSVISLTNDIRYHCCNFAPCHNKWNYLSLWCRLHRARPYVCLHNLLKWAHFCLCFSKHASANGYLINGTNGKIRDWTRLRYLLFMQLYHLFVYSISIRKASSKRSYWIVT